MAEFSFPEAFAPVLPDLSEIDAPQQSDFQNWMYAFIPGGRGGGRSRSVGAYIILRMRMPGLRVLCAREIQFSIRDSVHLLLRDEIERQGLGQSGTGEFTVTDAEIRHQNGNFIMFRGLHKNIDSLKSIEGLNLVWIEEAQSVSKESIDKLIPTVIRNKGAQFIFSFNPENESDPVWIFMKSNPPRSIVLWMSLDDNPWATDDLRAQRAHDYATDPDNAAWIWGGQLRKNSGAVVLRGKVSIREFEAQASWDGPYYGIDWGFSTDPTAANRVWIHNDTIWIDYEAHGGRNPDGNSSEIDVLPELLMMVPGMDKHVSRADNSRPETISYVKRHGFPRIQACRKWPGCIEDGIARLRGFSEIVIHPRCEHTILETRLYSHKVDRLSGDVLPEIIDKHNHHMDAIRYAIQPLIYGEKRPAEPPPEPEQREEWEGGAGSSWMGR